MQTGGALVGLGLSVPRWPSYLRVPTYPWYFRVETRQNAVDTGDSLDPLVIDGVRIGPLSQIAVTCCCRIHSAGLPVSGNLDDLVFEELLPLKQSPLMG